MTSLSSPRASRGWRHAAGLTAGSVAALGALSYWLSMSPYSQVLGPFPYRGAANGKIIALTFDDGPNERYTSQIADFLDGHSIKATFFQVGRAVDRHPEVTTRLAHAGHVIGHHGYAHEFAVYLRRRTLAEDVQRGTDAFTRVGIRPALYRPPWLLRIPALPRILTAHQLQIVSGEFCHALEVFQPSPERIARRALAKVQPGTILIFHDGFDGHPGYRGSTVEAVKIIVDRLLEQEYNFVTVDRLLGVPAYQPDRHRTATDPRRPTTHETP
jgi:peptidoglycan/xylan/chitin deacetylase (PgdA/CDA1 family)